MLDPEELACLREDAELTLPSVGTIQSLTLESDERGGHTETWGTEGTLACRVARLKDPVEVVNANKVTALADYRIYVPATTSLSLSSEKRIIVEGATYEIIRADLNQSEQILGVLFALLIQ